MFFGRVEELRLLTQLYGRKGNSFVLVKGRRRIGKSTLIKEFCRRQKIQLYEFQGLPPGKGIGRLAQLENFQNTIAEYLNVEKIEFRDWQRALEGLARLDLKKKSLILLDEISWMGIGDPAFASQLKSAWDRVLKESPHLMLVVSGSVSSWIEENISKNTGFVGRVSAELDLKELDLHLCYNWARRVNKNIRAIDFWKFISLVGGVPKYIEELSLRGTPENNLRDLFFKPSGFFYSEFEKIFSEVFNKKGVFYREILQVTSGSKMPPAELARKLKLPLNKDFSRAIFELESAGFLSRDYAWSFSGQTSKKSRLRIRDNFVRFYLRYMNPQKERVKKISSKSLPSSIHWDVLFGLQFENIVMNNLDLVFEELGISQNEVENIGPYFQPATRGRKGVQIDLLIQAKYKNLYLCEIKTQEDIRSNVIEEVDLKIKNMRKPRGFSIRPCLITIYPVATSVLEEDYFYKILNLTDVVCETGK